MKRQHVLWIGLGGGIILALWTALDFEESQKALYHKTLLEKEGLYKGIKSLKEEVKFLQKNQNKINSLMEKGWFQPNSRLIGGEAIENLKGPLTTLQYTFEPETTKSLEDGNALKITQMDLEVTALLDTHIYSFTENLLEQFPGVLTPVELTFTREDEINKKNLEALKQNATLSFIKGKLIFEWFAMEGKIDAK